MQKLNILRSFTFWCTAGLLLSAAYTCSYTATALTQTLHTRLEKKQKKLVTSLYKVKPGQTASVLTHPGNKVPLQTLEPGDSFMVIKFYNFWAYGQTADSRLGYVNKDHLTLVQPHEH
jgi:hypothetical protein